jgi:hypothetical protein
VFIEFMWNVGVVAVVLLKTQQQVRVVMLQDGLM